MTTTVLTGRELRAFPLSGVQVQRASDDGRLSFHGQAIVYDQLSGDMGGWRERIMPGAASRTLETSPDVRFLVNHNPDLLLARTASGTLTLTEHEGGVAVAADMANVSYARDVAELLDRGDLNQMSFGFWITAHGWAGDVHEVYGIDLDGGDVSVVTYPAFPQTSAELRSQATEHLTHPGGDEVPLGLHQHKLRELGLLAQL
ncbi:hypothetical protein SAMN02982929_05313 [Saccharopolyspora kobensis]|uniref:Prohead serine protease domain-containing protein n=1 Tax=Saccharopolyspora kobensis TaxID=146035 RepID=A0A1H6DZL5_9PSEU|nr:HK97 family phage prohead protease [Saccharopolyspora kobensis]SEG90788.1 hypothetical protein SAMN02982929_05313 [Saccharopolyspora kobensis]SFD93852.1 hypothetical protein SAMN05216506_107289 [Saccharopolyspora kobensis]